MNHYKEKTEEFIKDLNIIISDPMLFPERKSVVKFILEFSNGMIDEKDAVKCYFGFREDEVKHEIMSTSQTGGDLDSFYHRCYWQIFRNVLFTEDSVFEASVEFNMPRKVFLSFKTLAYKGLK